jgi:hypothetical protein
MYKYHSKAVKKDAVFLKPIDKEVKKEINKKFFNIKERHENKSLISNSYKKIGQLLKRNKKVFCYFSTKTNLEYAEQIFGKTYNCEFYSGVSQNIIPDDLNIEWSNKDLIATTGSITVGLNHDKKDVFYTKIIDFNSSSKNNVSDAIQSHFRIRHIISNKIYVLVEENHVASNFPINMKSLENTLEHKKDWYNKQNKKFSAVPTYIRNLIKNNYFENQLSQVAPTKMMIRYLTDCNYNIVENFEENDEEKDEEKETEGVDEENDENEEKEPEEQVDLIKEFSKDCPNFIRVKELEDQKLKRKLTQKELDEIDKYWFIQMYTGGTIKGLKDTSLPTIALAHRIWTAKFRSNTIYAMRLEKKVLEGKITIEQLIEKRWDKTQFSELQKTDIIKLKRVIEVCKKLGVKHSNDTDTEISQDIIDEFYEEAKHEYEDIMKDMGIEDRRVDKESAVNIKQFTGAVKGVFSRSEHSLCCLKSIRKERKEINGKRIQRSIYKLVPNEFVKDNTALINNYVNKENLKYDEPKYEVIKEDNCSRDIYMKLRDNTYIDEEKERHKRILRK